MFQSDNFWPLLLLLFTFSACEGQSDSPSIAFTSENFDARILQYEPPRRPGVTDKDYQKGRFFLAETRSATGNNPAELNVGDYWNITMSFLKLQEPKTHIEIAFRKAIEANPQSICAYIAHLGKAKLDKIIPEIFLPFYRNCSEESSESTSFDLAQYLKDTGLNTTLTTIMYRLDRNDRRYRDGSGDMKKQAVLDRENQTVIDSLFQIHGVYIGRSQVGEKLENSMWAVVQHSNLEMMERYLPVVEAAVQSGELSSVVPLKMLIDRIYWLKDGYQIFGSQAGIDLADPAVIERVKERYTLE